MGDFIRLAYAWALDAADALRPQSAADYDRIVDRAFHHGVDLMAHRAGLRTTTRCLPDYEPDRIELWVENRLRESLSAS